MGQVVGGKTVTSPAHPLVIDRITKVARLVTQADIDRMESICVAYASVVANARGLVLQAENLTERLENACGR